MNRAFGSGARITALAFLAFSSVAIAQDADGDGLRDQVDSCPRRVYSPGFDWMQCGPMDGTPANDFRPECKARERVALHLLQQSRDARHIAFSIVRGGQVHFADAFERTVSGFRHDPTGIHRLYRIGSTSKSMAAVTAKILEESHQLLSFQDFVSDVDGTRVTSGGQRTLHNLLTHDGCFKQEVGAIHLYCYPGGLQPFWKDTDDLISPRYASTRYGNLRGGFVYSAWNYGLAGTYLETRAGVTYDRILQSVLFDRASMCSASFDGVRAHLAPIGGTVGVSANSLKDVGPYINLVAPNDPKCVDNFYNSNDVYGQNQYSKQSYRLDECSAPARDPAGGVIASVVDIAHFARVLLDSYHGRAGALISKQGIRDLWKPTHDYRCGNQCPYQRYYATGFFVRQASGPGNEVEHGGVRPGYTSVFVLRPELDLAISMLVDANVDIVAMNRVAKTILDDFEAAERGQWGRYGAGCNGTWLGKGSATPSLDANRAPVLASTIDLRLMQARAQSVAVCFLGASKMLWSGLTLPLDLAALGAKGCSVLAAGDLLIAIPIDTQGSARFPVAIPNQASLYGTDVFVQALVFDAPANSLGIVSSNGVELLIGR